MVIFRSISQVFNNLKSISLFDHFSRFSLFSLFSTNYFITFLYKRRSTVRKVVLSLLFIFFYSVTFGTIFLDNILTEEQLTDWQNYWRNLAFVGLVDKKITDYKIEQVEEEQKAALNRLELNKIK